MSDSDEICSVTSFTLTVRQVRWLKENVDNRSELIRRLLDEHIEYVDGYDGLIAELSRKREGVAATLDDLDARIAEAHEKQGEYEQRSDGDTDERIRRLKRELGGRS